MFSVPDPFSPTYGSGALKMCTDSETHKERKVTTLAGLSNSTTSTVQTFLLQRYTFTAGIRIPFWGEKVQLCTVSEGA